MKECTHHIDPAEGPDEAEDEASSPPQDSPILAWEEALAPLLQRALGPEAPSPLVLRVMLLSGLEATREYLSPAARARLAELLAEALEVLRTQERRYFDLGQGLDVIVRPYGAEKPTSLS